MTAFDSLHPALRHHIVNSLGWRELRPFQEATIPPLLAGKHAIVLAPTAGGKTEAALFPVLSQMLTEDWSALSVLYICPIKALLNNLDERLQRYCRLLGRSSGLWHGDISPSVKQRMLREPPDCLLTTPESLEVMLISSRVDAEVLFGHLRVVIIDEIHAFAGDDRGWHLLSVLQRVNRLAEGPVQRVGLSATVGNPEALLDWMVGSNPDERCVHVPPPDGGTESDVSLDYVGSLQNAAVVISRLHRGEKRLVFVDSRARAEMLGSELRAREVTTFVTHSSLSADQRRQAEEAFAERENCVIVATSALELGIDVGDLDRVIQIDAPSTVASFLQRMGRTGRRSGTVRNCLFLATDEQALIHAAGLIRLWETGYVEPIVPPATPYHILAQQLMALTLQEQGIGRSEWFAWIEAVKAYEEMPQERIDEIVGWMCENGILWDDEGILSLGREGESTYGRRNFMELFSVFVAPPLFAVRQGRRELGYVDQMTFMTPANGPRVLLLGGRSWRITDIDWRHRIVQVVEHDGPGRSRWSGQGAALSFDLCQMMKQVLVADDEPKCWSQRASEEMERQRDAFDFLQPDKTSLVMSADGNLCWWTFAGARANGCLVAGLNRDREVVQGSDNLSLEVAPTVDLSALREEMAGLKDREATAFLPRIDSDAVDQLKFNECVPSRLATQMLEARLQDVHGASAAIVAALVTVAAR